MENDSSICCPKFEPAPWDGQTTEWKDRHFVKDKVFCLFHMPINFGSVITKLMGKIEKSGAKSPDNMALSDHTSMFNMDLYVSTNKTVEGAENVDISGTFYSKVYEGPFQDTGKWIKEFSEELKTKNISMKKMYMWYTTCPKCAKKYGKNYVVLLAQTG